MNPNERDIISMTRDVWNEHLAHVQHLEKIEKFFECLRAAGVDNWEGYSDALDMLYGGEDDDDE